MRNPLSPGTTLVFRHRLESAELEKVPLNIYGRKKRAKRAPNLEKSRENPQNRKRTNRSPGKALPAGDCRGPSNAGSNTLALGCGREMVLDCD